MKALSPLLLIAGALHGAPAPAQPTVASPLQGSWAVDLERLPMPPEARPKSVTISFGEADGGKWTTQVDIVGRDGSASHAKSSYTPDGTASPVEGSPEADTSAVQLPRPDVMVLALGKNGIPASTRIYTVNPDGKTMVETAVYFSRDGVPIMRTNYFNRIR